MMLSISAQEAQTLYRYLTTAIEGNREVLTSLFEGELAELEAIKSIRLSLMLETNQLSSVRNGLAALADRPASE